MKSLMDVLEQDIFRDRPDIKEKLEGNLAIDKDDLDKLSPEDRENLKNGIISLLQAADLIDK